MTVDFIGIGAQKAGTSWVYSCLYEHPDICAPVKEIHFFSRPRYRKGLAYYESHWKNCESHLKRGEYSTSYLYSEETPERIAEAYPDAKLIAILRHPLERAYSQYRNAIKAGEIADTVTFAAYQAEEVSALEQGRYNQQLERYVAAGLERNLLVLLYDDIVSDPQESIAKIYRHIGVDSAFMPPSLHARVNVARTPKDPRIDGAMHMVAECLRKSGFDRVVHMVKRSGLTDWIRSRNTKVEKRVKPSWSGADWDFFRSDVAALDKRLGRNVSELWDVQ